MKPCVNTKCKDYNIGEKFNCEEFINLRACDRYLPEGCEAQEPATAAAERGPKESAGKTHWRVFPFLEAEHVVRVFKKGADKYGGPFTYRRSIPVEELAEAAIRHATAILNGERIDNESGELHAAHLSANGLMMISQSISDIEK